MAYTTINKSTDYFNTVLWSGDNVDGRAITTGFETDWTWVKRRNSTNGHIISDSVRGATYKLDSSTTGAEVNNYDGGHLESFTSTGFTMGVGSGDFGHLNASGGTYASWNWKANGQGSSNTDGSINTTYTSVNTTAGFSIVSFTGTGSNATVGHGLGVVPQMVIIKDRTSGTANDWFVYHKNIGATKYVRLNDTGAEASSSTLFQDTDPTSSVFYIGTNGNVNTSGNTYIAYCFAEKKGYSKFGSYTGAGSNLPFIYTGFKPAFVLLKNIVNSSDDWHIFDNKRANTFNPADKNLLPNLSNAEGTSAIDLVSNGFKIRATSGFMNRSGEKIIYMAFAEAPLVGSNNVPCTAR